MKTFRGGDILWQPQDEAYLNRNGIAVNRKLIQSLISLMGPFPSSNIIIHNNHINYISTHLQTSTHQNDEMLLIHTSFLQDNKTFLDYANAYF
jgi:hypothetical protein